MAKLIFFSLMSLDGYIEDPAGRFDWAAPDDEVHGFVNDQVRNAGAFLYGRRMYETMAVWETDPELAAGSPVTGDFARLWQAADKIVFSRTLAAVATARTRLEREFDPEQVRRLKAASERDLLIGGPQLAGRALAARLVDECQLVVMPAVLGGGKPCFSISDHLALELLEERRFSAGAIFLRYRVK